VEFLKCGIPGKISIIDICEFLFSFIDVYENYFGSQNSPILKTQERQPISFIFARINFMQKWF
jgi:hypothetical protein